MQSELWLHMLSFCGCDWFQPVSDVGAAAAEAEEEEEDDEEDDEEEDEEVERARKRRKTNDRATKAVGR